MRSSIDARPFEVMTGTSPVTLSDLLVLAPPINGTLNMDNVCGSATAYAEHARNHSDFMRKKNAEVLNKHGHALINN